MTKERTISILCAAACIMTASGCVKENNGIKYEYGVFIGAGPENIDDMLAYKKLVIDAQYYSADEIAQLKESGHTVYSYIDLGSVENFRPYYDRFEKYTLDVYENWEDEKWVDVSQEEWQTFVVDELAVSMVDKGVDGLFVDNTDVYYHYKTNEIFDGVTAILKGFKALDTYVIINGGDCYVKEYAGRNDSISEVMDAENQETVFSRIIWEDESFSSNEDTEREYFQQYVELVDSYGGDVYLLEYTTDNDLIDDIDNYCDEHGFSYYASDKLELTVPAPKDGSQRI